MPKRISNLHVDRDEELREHLLDMMGGNNGR